MEIEIVIEKDMYQGPLKSDVYKKRVDISHVFLDIHTSILVTDIEIWVTI